MKSISVTGLILLVISLGLFYMTTNFDLNELKLSHFMGFMAGIGAGLLIGGMVGYVSKGSAIKEAERKREMQRLREEKAALEKQAAELAARKTESTTTNSGSDSLRHF